jgi:hypothetical protein
VRPCHLSLQLVLLLDRILLLLELMLLLDRILLLLELMLLLWKHHGLMQQVTTARLAVGWQKELLL